jgi:hypothetical protein
VPLTLTVDGDRWRAHLRTIVDRHPGLVPVIKGNGYGVGRASLARRSGWLGVETVAVGTYDELTDVAERFDGDLLVLTPWRPGTDLEALAAKHRHRVIHTVSRTEDLDALLGAEPGSRIVVEALTSMRRHGIAAAEVVDAVRRTSAHAHARLEGLAVHLPMAGDHLGEVESLLAGVGDGIGQVWVSHLRDAELDTLRSAHPGVRVRPRVGTDLWLGEPASMRMTATVLDVHPIAKGEPFGYWGRGAAGAGHLLIVSGGTAHGVGLESPRTRPGLRNRAATMARGGLDAIGRVRSPFWIDGEPRLFAEPPHMQASMLFLPFGVNVPAVGTEVEARLRHTATTFDRVVID